MLLPQEFIASIGRQLFRRRRIGGKKIPVALANLLLAFELAHGIGGIVSGVEADGDDPEAVFAEHLARLAHHGSDVLGGGRADVVATGIDQADDQRFAGVFGQRPLSARGIIK